MNIVQQISVQCLKFTSVEHDGAASAGREPAGREPTVGAASAGREPADGAASAGVPY